MNSQNGSLLSLKLGTGRTITAPCMYHLVERYGSFWPPPKNECTQHTDTCSSKRSHMQMFIRRKRWNETRINMEPTYLAFITSKLLRHSAVSPCCRQRVSAAGMHLLGEWVILKAWRVPQHYLPFYTGRTKEGFGFCPSSQTQKSDQAFQWVVSLGPPRAMALWGAGIK